MIESTAFALVTLLVVVDPPGTAALFMSMTPHDTPAERRRQAIRAVAIAFVVLVAFALIGGALLRALGIGLPAMQVAGGLLLFLTAAEMVMGRHMLRATPEEEAAAAQQSDISVFPLAIPLLAGPGAMTSLVVLREKAHGDVAQVLGILFALVVTLGLTLAALLAAAQVTRWLGRTGPQVLGRVLGVLLAALAAQMALDGLRQSF